MRNLSKEELNALFIKILKPHYKYSLWFVIGFGTYIPEDSLWVANERYKQSGKRIMLVNPFGKAWELIRQIEADEDFKIERICNDAMYELGFLGVGWCDENGLSITPKIPLYKYEIPQPEWPELPIEKCSVQVQEPYDLFCTRVINV